MYCLPRAFEGEWNTIDAILIRCKELCPVLICATEKIEKCHQNVETRENKGST